MLFRSVGDHPLRERLWEHLMLALYRCGRRADALQVYQRIRSTMVEELGLDPAAELQQFLDQWDAKLKVLLGRDADEARAWLGQYMSAMADGYRQQFLKKMGLTDVSHATAAQINAGLGNGAAADAQRAKNSFLSLKCSLLSIIQTTSTLSGSGSH